MITTIRLSNKRQASSLGHQIIVGNNDDSYSYKSDATWFIRPALAKVDYVTIDFDIDEA